MLAKLGHEPLVGAHGQRGGGVTAAPYATRALRLLARLLRLFALVASLVIVIGFALFAQEQGAAASDRQRQLLEGPGTPIPSISDERDRERRHGAFREGIDEANDFLFTPFAAFIEGRNIWIQRLITAVLGLLLYGLVPTIAANYVRK
ncbi:MAG: hypothetical protein ACR2NV_00035 [Thermoleophilaceae bacterium]